MRIHTSVGATIITILSVGCNFNPPKTGPFGHGYNEERRTRHIPIIPDGWNGRGGYREADWGNPDLADPKTTRNPMHARKEIFVDASRGLHREYDYYYSGKEYPSQYKRDSTDREELTIRYDFEAARMGQNPWRCEVNCGPHYRFPPRAGEVCGQVTFEEAEAILKDWGISRLNY
jgi:hypothetical protein